MLSTSDVIDKVFVLKNIDDLKLSGFPATTMGYSGITAHPALGIV